MLTKQLIGCSCIFVLLLISIVSGDHNHIHHPHQQHKSGGHHFTHTSFDDDHNDPELDAEALLGSREEAQHFSDLEPEEAKESLRKLLKEGQVDKNKDGFIDLDELSRWVERNFRKLAKQESLDVFKEEDTDNDGFLSWQEHYDGSFSMEDPLTPDAIQMLAEDKEMWKAADLDQDNQLSPDEYDLFNNPEEHRQMYDTIYTLTMRRRDDNKDGRLSFEEYIRSEDGEMPDPKSEQFIVEKDRFEKDLDLDHDRHLNKEEIMGWVLPNSEETSKNEATHLIQVCDDNHDGKLTLNEILEHVQEFLNSEATNFGQNLNHDELWLFEYFTAFFDQKIEENFMPNQIEPCYDQWSHQTRISCYYNLLTNQISSDIFFPHKIVFLLNGYHLLVSSCFYFIFRIGLFVYQFCVLFVCGQFGFALVKLSQERKKNGDVSVRPGLKWWGGKKTRTKK